LQDQGCRGMVRRRSSATSHDLFRRLTQRLRKICVFFTGGSPVQTTLQPQPYQPGKQDHDEDRDLDQPGEPQFVPYQRPGKDEGRFNVKDDEEDRHQVERHRPGQAGGAAGGNPGFIGHLLGGRGAPGPQPPGGQQQHADQRDGYKGIYCKMIEGSGDHGGNYTRTLPFSKAAKPETGKPAPIFMAPAE